MTYMYILKTDLWSGFWMELNKNTCTSVDFSFKVICICNKIYQDEQLRDKSINVQLIFDF